MILDASHVRWAAGTGFAAVVTLGVFGYLDRRIPGGLTGGTAPGLWFGVIGTSLMVYCGLFALLRQVPAWWWIGSRQAWLRAHIWLGLLSVVVILAHSGFRFGGALGQALWVVLGIIIVSGVFGVSLQQMLPAVMKREIPGEASYEQMAHYCRVLKLRADELYDALKEMPSLSETADAAALRFDNWYAETVRPSFDVPPPRRTKLADVPGVRVWFDRIRRETLRVAAHADPAAEAARALEKLRERLIREKVRSSGAKPATPEHAEALKAADAEATKAVAALSTKLMRLLDTADPDGLGPAARATLKEVHKLADSANAADLSGEIDRACRDRWLAALEDLCAERAGFREQERYHRWLHGWLLLHVPFSAALLALTVAHVVMSLYY